MRMTLETAMIWLKRGYRIRRNHWDKFLIIEDRVADGEKITTVFPDGRVELTTLAAEDLLADDWVVHYIWTAPPTLDMSFCGSRQRYNKNCHNCTRNPANYSEVEHLPLTLLAIESSRVCRYYRPKE